MHPFKSKPFIIMAILYANRIVLGRLSNGASRSILLDRLRSNTINRSLFSGGRSSTLAFQIIPRQYDTRLAKQNTFDRIPFTHHSYQQIKLLSSTAHDETTSLNDLTNNTDFFANDAHYPDFASLGISSPVLLQRLASPPLNLSRPSSVQAASYDAISRGENVIVGAETGTGKTLAYLLPLVEDILKRKRDWKTRQMESDGDSSNIMNPGYSYARAIILVPNKELQHQAIRMAASICGGLSKCVIWGTEGVMAGINMNTYDSNDDESIPEENIVRLALFPGGLSTPMDYPPFRFASEKKATSMGRQPPPDLVFATPANLGPLALSPKNIDLFADVATLVVDEADMLLDGGYVRQLNNVLMGFRRADRIAARYDDSFSRKTSSDDDNDGILDNFDEEESKPKSTQHIFVAATLPDYGLRSVDAYLRKKFPDAVKITMAGMHNARHYGLEKESQTVWNEIDENQERMKRLVDVLNLDRSEIGVDGRGLKEEKVVVFLNTVNDVDGATNGLRRAGINAVPYHAQVPLEERAKNLDRFRRYDAPDNNESNKNDNDTVPVLVCTDVASRGLDIPGVTAVVQLQFATNVVIHLHRMGRCGRAGNSDGRGIVFYGAKERELVEVIREAEKHQSSMILTQDVEDGLGDEDSLDTEAPENKAKVRKAFSRKRGFTKKIKKARREARENDDGYD